MIATLIIFENEVEKKYYLGEKQKLRFGRTCPGNEPELSVSSPIVSRLHGEFIRIEGEWFYLDMESRNGTYYNGKRICLGLNGKARPILLSRGDVLQVDSQNLEKPDCRRVRIVCS